MNDDKEFQDRRVKEPITVREMFIFLGLEKEHDGQE
jgi:hypothetical protein